MNNVQFLIGAYAFIWVILAYYFFTTGKKLNKLEEKVARMVEEKEDSN